MTWKTKIPCKVNCFTWLLTKETVLTHDNLNKRGFHLCSRCFFVWRVRRDSQTSLPTLQMDKPVVANVHQYERDQMGETRKDQRDFKTT